ncbi:hypothetical protein BDA99DRAFT_504739 [Phascolomyces articulosus]|uniref:Uncharacterized protein n=1 Tax=Phascolomyces articulosus TaxID=60185 RepID=A0AAD5PHE4_9FUNG|nr:hypothetical protein BDA99DRAFT_504739 [Phascolomyces articulosus]
MERTNKKIASHFEILIIDKSMVNLIKTKKYIYEWSDVQSIYYMPNDTFEQVIDRMKFRRERDFQSIRSTRENNFPI